MILHCKNSQEAKPVQKKENNMSYHRLHLTFQYWQPLKSASFLSFISLRPTRLPCFAGKKHEDLPSGILRVIHGRDPINLMAEHGGIMVQ